MTERGCPGHPDLAEELRQYAGGALDLLEPWLDRVREQDRDAADPELAVCASCPVCAVITVLRGGRSELAVRLAEHATGLLAVLRAALEEGVGAHRPGAEPRRSGAEPRRDTEECAAPPRHRPPSTSGRSGRMVQRVEITRDGRGRPRGEPSREPC